MITAAVIVVTIAIGLVIAIKRAMRRQLREIEQLCEEIINESRELQEVAVRINQRIKGEKA